jgi:hypothetical protein
MPPICSQESAEVFSVEDWATVALGVNGVFTECRALKFAPKQVHSFLSPVRERAEEVLSVRSVACDRQVGWLIEDDLLRAELDAWQAAHDEALEHTDASLSE